MNTYPLSNQGRIFAFEIERVYIGVKRIASLLHSVDGVSDLSVRKVFSINTDIHVEFTYVGKAFIVWEPYADSSRYWIGPKEKANKQIDIVALESVFRQYQPIFFIKVLGDLLSFKFMAIVNRWIKSNYFKR